MTFDVIASVYVVEAFPLKQSLYLVPIKDSIKLYRHKHPNKCRMILINRVPYPIVFVYIGYVVEQMVYQ